MNIPVENVTIQFIPGLLKLQDIKVFIFYIIWPVAIGCSEQWVAETVVRFQEIPAESEVVDGYADICPPIPSLTIRLIADFTPSRFSELHDPSRDGATCARIKAALRPSQCIDELRI